MKHHEIRGQRLDKPRWILLSPNNYGAELIHNPVSDKVEVKQ